MVFSKQLFVFFSISLLFVPFCKLSNSQLDEREIISQMADWGFEHFIRATKLVENKTMQYNLNYNDLTIESFNLIGNLMKETKSNWTNDELHEILSIGNKFIATKESFDKIVNLVAKAIFETQFYITQLEVFPYFQARILEALDSLCNYAIDVEGNQLQLLGFKIPVSKKTAILEYFLFEARRYKNILIDNFYITIQHAKLIEKYSQTHPFIFYSTSNNAVINYQSPFSVSWLSIVDSTQLHIITGEETVLSLIHSIPSKILSGFIIYQVEMKELINQLSEIVDKMDSFFLGLTIYGDCSTDIFELVFEEFKKSNDTNIVLSASPYTEPTLLQLFTSKNNQRIFETRFLANSNKEEEGIFSLSSNSQQLCLNLTMGVFKFTKYANITNQFSINYLNVIIYDKNDVNFLSQLLNTNIVSKLNLYFNKQFENYDGIFEILKDQQLKSLSLNGIYHSSTDKLSQFLTNLCNYFTFWKELEYFRCAGFEFETVVQLLKVQMPKLKKLDLKLYDCYCSENQLSLIKIKSVKELVIEFSAKFSILTLIVLLKMFPMVERLSLSIPNELESAVEISNLDGQLKEVEIICKKLGDISVRKLLASSIKSVTIQQDHFQVKWNKDDDQQIYYQFELIKPTEYNEKSYWQLENQFL